jgi:1-acyl-sn-glycerol-3-phosphate acyltransferase
MVAGRHGPDQAPMLIVRSLLFNLAFYFNLVVWLLICIPAAALPRRGFIRVVQAWARSNLWLLRVLAGTAVEFRGRDRIPPGGVLVAAKHQSLWETFALLTVLEDPTFVLKSELMWLPLFGWFAWKAGMVSVNRSAGAEALDAMSRRAREEARRGRPIVIFPEGTRRPPGAEPAYKAGVAVLYASLNVPCVPVALNSGLFWPRRRFIRRPGTIVVEFLEPLPAGLSRGAFFHELRRRIEDASNRLLAEGTGELAAAGKPAGAGGLARPPA